MYYHLIIGLCVYRKHGDVQLFATIVKSLNLQQNARTVLEGDIIVQASEQIVSLMQSLVC